MTPVALYAATRRWRRLEAEVAQQQRQRERDHDRRLDLLTEADRRLERCPDCGDWRFTGQPVRRGSTRPMILGVRVRLHVCLVPNACPTCHHQHPTPGRCTSGRSVTTSR